MFKLIYPKFWQTRSFISYLLWPLSYIFRFLTVLRKFYTRTIFFNAKVICIGNITVGGTGKSQLVIWLANKLRQSNIDFVILTKGYSGNLKIATIVTNDHTAFDVGDESIMLKEHGTVVAARKPSYAKKIINQLKPRVIIVDDGMQNPSFLKDFVLLTIDGARGLGNGFMIPAGPLRQSVSQGFQNSDAVVVVESDVIPSFGKEIRKYHLPIFKANIVAQNHLSTLKNYFAFSAIGNPERFLNSLMKCKIQVAGFKNFPDHYHYNDRDIESLISIAGNSCAQLITTAKDYVKIPYKYKEYVLCFNTKLIIDEEQQLLELINGKIT